MANVSWLESSNLSLSEGTFINESARGCRINVIRRRADTEFLPAGRQECNSVSLDAQIMCFDAAADAETMYYGN